VQSSHSRNLRQIDWTTDPAFTSFLTQNVINPALVNTRTGSDAAILAALAGLAHPTAVNLEVAPSSATSTLMRGNLPIVGSNNPSSQQSATTSGLSNPLQGLSNPLQGLGNLLSGVGAALQGNSNRAGAASQKGTGVSSSTQYSSLATAGPYSFTGSSSYNSADGQQYSSSGASDARQYSQLSLAANGRPLGSSGTSAGLLQQGILSAKGLAQSVQQAAGSPASTWPSSNTAWSSQQYIIPETSSVANQYQLGSLGYTPETPAGYDTGPFTDDMYNQLAADTTYQQRGSSLSNMQYTTGPGTTGQYSGNQLLDAGQYSIQNPNAQGAFDPTTGELVVWLFSCYKSVQQENSEEDAGRLCWLDSMSIYCNV
jgi:hypothetical protein